MKKGRTIGMIFGVMAGLGGLRHGIGEIRQGNVSPESIPFDSWTQGPISSYMDGEPALSVIPNLLVTGILAVILSTVVIGWSLTRVRGRRGATVLILLSTGLFLVGGGFGPPVVGLLAGVAALKLDSPHPWWQAHISRGTLRLLATLWPWAFGISVINGLFLFIGSLILVYAIDFNHSNLFLGSFFVLIVSLMIATVAGMADDIKRRDPEPGSWDWQRSSSLKTG